MSHCPQCGGLLAVQWVDAEEHDRLVCQSCGFVVYQNPKLVAATITEQDGRVYLIRRAVAPMIGFWGLPAGYVELGESVEQAALRETKEETGLDVELTSLLNVYSWTESAIVVVAFLARVVGGTPTPSSETLDVQSFSPDSIPWHDLAFPNTVRALQDWLRSRLGEEPHRRSVRAITP
ncbi:MAG: NUDIX hydrolase [Chloroflexi bacterium]|nr:NUDIX hydrolase [Chloroflexota bacterium]